MKIAAILLVFAGILFVVFVALLKQYRKEKQNVYEKEVAKIPAIICIGDSLTHGTEGDEDSYPYYLWQDLRDEGIFIPVLNYGVGGENVPTICGRVGAVPYTLHAFTIPETEEMVEIAFVQEEGKSIEPLLQGGEGQLNPCVIDGVGGTITLREEDGVSRYYFSRSEEGEVVEVGEGAEVVTNASEGIKDGILAIFIGENGGYEDIDDLIWYQHQIIDMQEDDCDYLILGLTSGSAEERKELESRMLEEYGDRYINLREYLITDGLEYAVDKGLVSVSDSDKAQIEQGIVPDCLRTDSVHYTKTGYKLVEMAVYDRLFELGYFDSIEGIVKEFRKKWGIALKVEKGM